MVNNIDEQLIEKIKSAGCYESLRELSEKHSPLFNKVYTKYAGPLFGVGFSRKQAFDEKIILFYQAVMSFDPARNVKFTTYFANFARWHFLDTINHTEKLNLIEDENMLNHVQAEIKRDSSEFYIKLPALIDGFEDDRIKKIYTLRYLQQGKPKKWREIADEIGFSVQTCAKLHKRGIAQLKEAIEKIDILA